VTTSDTVAIWATVALCAVIAIIDPAARLKRWWRSKHAQAPGEVGHLNVERVDGAVPVAAAPSTRERVFFQVELTPDEVRHINAVMEWRYSHTRERARA
jgi:hypothetical protein